MLGIVGFVTRRVVFQIVIRPIMTTIDPTQVGCGPMIVDSQAAFCWLKIQAFQSEAKGLPYVASFVTFSHEILRLTSILAFRARY